MKPAAQKSQAAQVARSAAMLPTPSKTPQKPPCEKAAANLKSFARNLFPSEDSAIASPRKKRTSKLSGMGIESFAGDEVEEPIHIFTDSQDRIPKKDDSDSNPFFNAGQHETPRRSKRRQIMIPGEGFQSIEEASRREDGMIYVFRGKKFFRKFAEAKDEEHGSENEADGQSGRALTRSSIKPRLLFPVKKTEKTKEMLEEEETTTDIEEGHSQTEENEPQTPTKIETERAKTPEAPKFAPVSPPDTKRVTRSTNKLADAPTPVKIAKKKSPFDSWRRTKESSATPTSTKRQGEPLASTAMKRARA
ncbi:hypothetical protein ESCO_003823 [Escovopsis weberi]|uniref:Uncharacterized protein n=1 Tax=Escovopsis weberi TaxID=150374 RepID=A0A0M8N4I4_ESCWE|nr:hypothetical protein ESCO_003823 [Escovopsis weberi]